MTNTYEQLMAQYEKASEVYDSCKFGTKKAEQAGKRLDKACEALEQWRANNKPADTRSLAERIQAL